MDIVFISELEIQTVIGVFDWERKIRQTVSIDLEMETDITQAGRLDDLQYTLDYKSITKRIIEFVEASHFLLIESLAEGIAHLLRDEFNITWLKLRLSKPGAIRSAKTVGVIIERGQRA